MFDRSPPPRFRHLPWLLLFAAHAITAQDLRLIAPEHHVIGAPYPVRLELYDALGSVDRDQWNAQATLSATGDATLSKTSVQLINGIGTVLLEVGGVQNFELRAASGGLSASRQVVRIEPTALTMVSGTLPGLATSWAGAILVTDDVVVPDGHTLRIEPGTTVLVRDVDGTSTGRDLDVFGTVLSEGTAERPVNITSEKISRNWGQIEHNDAEASSYRYTFITKAGREASAGHTDAGISLNVRDSEILFDHCTISDFTDTTGRTVGKIMYGVRTDLVFRDTVMARARMGPELRGCSFIATNSWIVEMKGPDDCDGVYLHDSGGRPLILSGCVLAYGDDDAIDTLDSEVVVENCIIRNWLNPKEDAKGLSIFNGSVKIDRLMLAECYAGISAKWSRDTPALVLLSNSTILSQTNGVAATLKGNAPGPFIDYRITNCIIQASPSVVTDFGKTNFQIGYCLLSHEWEGAGNVTGTSRFVDASALNFHLVSTSPAIDIGDPATPLDMDGTRADAGVYPYLRIGPRILTLIDSEGRLRLRVGGLNGQQVRLQSSGDLVEWQDENLLLIRSRAVEWQENSQPSGPRFYRGRLE